MIDTKAQITELNSIVSEINNACGEPLLSHFTVNPHQYYVIENHIDAHEKTTINLTDDPITKELVANRTLDAIDRLMRKLKKLKDELERLT